MNAFDYLLGKSGFLHKNFILGNREEISYSELYQKSLGLARYLVDTYGQDNNILLISPNNTYFIVAYMAIMKSGNVCVPLNPSIEPENLRFIIDVCNAGTVFIDESLKKKNWEMIDEVIFDYGALVKSKKNGTSDALDQNGFDEDRLAEIIFTSGSTGEPKGVMISHGNIIANTRSIVKYLELTGDDIIEIVLPLLLLLRSVLASYPYEGGREHCTEQYLYVHRFGDQ